MTLQEFVTESLIEIVSGVKTAQDRAKENGAIINPYGYVLGHMAVTRDRGTTNSRGVQQVDFDVAITIQSTDTVKGGIGVFAGALGLGGQAQTEGQSTNLSRIKFSIPVCLPEQQP